MPASISAGGSTELAVQIADSQVGKKLVDHAIDYSLPLSKEGANTYRIITQNVL